MEPGKCYIVHPSRSDVIRLWCLADMHLGNIGVAKHRLQADIDEIRKDPYSFWVGGGDYADYISPGDRRRFDAECIDPETLAVCDMQRVGSALTEAVVKWLGPIKHKCLGLCFGNHESSYMREQEQTDLHAVLCHRLGVPNLRYSGLVLVRAVRMPKQKGLRLLRESPTSTYPHRTWRLFIHHGAGGAATKSGKANRLEKFAQLTTADICFIGHCHDATVMSCPVLDVDECGRNIVERKRLAVMTGSYLRTYMQGVTGYGERRGYPPATLGAVWVSIKPETGEIEAPVRA